MQCRANQYHQLHQNATLYSNMLILDDLIFIGSMSRVLLFLPSCTGSLLFGSLLMLALLQCRVLIGMPSMAAGCTVCSSDELQLHTCLGTSMIATASSWLNSQNVKCCLTVITGHGHKLCDSCVALVTTTLGDMTCLIRHDNLA